MDFAQSAGSAADEDAAERTKLLVDKKIELPQ
jgi:hypothetical protein